MLGEGKSRSFSSVLETYDAERAEGLKTPYFFRGADWASLPAEFARLFQGCSRVSHQMEESFFVYQLLRDSLGSPCDSLADLCCGSGRATAPAAHFLRVPLVQLDVAPSFPAQIPWDATCDPLPVHLFGTRCCAVSVHPCGQLAISVVSSFLDTPEVAHLVLIPCCCDGDPRDWPKTVQRALRVLSCRSRIVFHPRLKEHAIVAAKVPQRLLVALVGIPGAGKSTVCRGLVKSLPFKVCHVEYDTEEAPLETLAAAFERDGSEVVLADDNAFYPSIRKQLRRLAEEHRAVYMELYVEADEHVAWERNARRPASSRVSRESFDRVVQRIKEQPPTDYFTVDRLDQLHQLWLDKLHDENVESWVIDSNDVAAQQAELRVRHWISDAIRAVPPSQRKKLAAELQCLKKKRGAALTQGEIRQVSTTNKKK